MNSAMPSSVLLADVGGTNARFAVMTNASAALRMLRSFRCTDFPHLLAAVLQYLDMLRLADEAPPAAFYLAVAATLQGDDVRFTNNHWHFSQASLQQSLSMPVTILNDFEAQAWCLHAPQQLTLRWLNRPDGEQHTWPVAVRTIAGPGTGFGAAALTPAGDVLSCEPGHASFAARNESELALLRELWRWYPRVTIEHLVSGPGLRNIHCALSAQAGKRISPPDAPSASDIVTMADTDKLAAQTLMQFSQLLGAVCGDIALYTGSRGGVFLSGALLKALGAHFDEQQFMHAFVDKSSHSSWCQSIPVAYVEDEFPGLRGCAILASQLMCAPPSKD